MVATDKVFAGSIPQIYDRFLVPLIFESYALDLAGRLAETGPQDVLEMARVLEFSRGRSRRGFLYTRAS